MKKTNKLTQQYCLHFDEATAREIETLAQHHQRNASEYLRLLLLPIIINEYALLMKKQYSENNTPPEKAIFKQ